LSKQKYKYFILLSDVFFLMLSLYITAFLSILSFDFKVSKYLNYELSLFILLFITTILIYFRTENLYKLNYILVKSHQLVAILKSILYSCLTTCIILVIFFPKFFYENRNEIIVSYTVATLLIVLYRVIFLRKFLIKKKSHSILVSNVVIIGTGNLAKKVALKAIIDNPVAINLLGFIDEKESNIQTVLSIFDVLGNIENLKEIVEKRRIDEIIIAVENCSYEKILEIIDRCREVKIPIRIHSDIFNVINESLPIERYANIPLVDFRTLKNLSLYNFYKRIIDILLSSVALIILSPFFLIIAIIIKIESKGPVFFKQKRIGLNGKEFCFYKFRSMVGKEEDDEFRKQKMIEFMNNNGNGEGKFNKVINSNRITKVGRFLRKYSIDELPQLINVVKGDMSLVGPRPCLPYEYENYEEWQKKRFEVLPGCTGIWQVYGRGKVNFIDSIILDIFYVSNRSPWLDTVLILKTLPVIISGKGGG